VSGVKVTGGTFLHTLHAYYAHVFRTTETEGPFTHFTYMRLLSCVRAHVLSKVTYGEQRFYYTRYKYTASPLCVCACVLLHETCLDMPAHRYHNSTHATLR
jgi:hypothetical protein